jgi:16S rRNA (cytidine1402-2'-O)-methyltransferase
VALVSDAGMPLISDPGWNLVRQARERDIEVLSVPGPSAVSAALSVAGLATDRYVFEGFLPRRAGQREQRLQQLAAETRTMVFFESVHRIEDSLAAMAAQFGAERPAAVARELTKLHERTYTDSLGGLLARVGADIPQLGEFVVLVAGREQAEATNEAELKRVYELLAAELPAARALALSAKIVGVARNVAYRLMRVPE